MTKEQILQEIQQKVSQGVKRKEIEDAIGLPQNSLSNIMAGRRAFPSSCIDSAILYLTGQQVSDEPVYEKIEPDVVVTEKGSLKEVPSLKKIALTSATLDKINKDFGAGTVMKFGDRPQKGYKTVSTGSILLDKAIGIGGLPRGRFIEIYGPESSGKTTLCLHVVANAQKQGLRCLWVDAENSFDPEYAMNLGVDVNEMHYCQPTFGEQGFEVVDRMITAGDVDCVVIDSVAAMIPKGELDGETGDAKMGLHARLMSQVCRKLVTVVAKKDVLLLFINQIRNKIGVMYGSPEVTTGGMALQFYASVRLDVRRSTAIKDGDEA
ncbi:MAG TPA: recombinase RecA, partial [Methanosarcina sp.]|nr:recombinase RecA [Methanosarcina sp.]